MIRLTGRCLRDRSGHAQVATARLWGLVRAGVRSLRQSREPRLAAAATLEAFSKAVADGLAALIDLLAGGTSAVRSILQSITLEGPLREGQRSINLQA